MALLYFKYDTDFGNTIVDKSETTFAPLPPYGEVLVDFNIPEIQPLYLYRESGGAIIANLQENVDAYLESIAPTPTGDDNVTYAQYSATTAQQDAKINAFTGSTGLQEVTNINALTTIESTFNGGLITGSIRPTGDTVTAIQIRKADGTTVVINIDSVSGLTGFNEVNPQGVIHAYGTDSSDENPLGTQKNAVIIDTPSNADADIQWAENGVPKWLAETYRNEFSRFWYLYNVEAEISPLTIRETGRIGFNKNTNIMDSHAAHIVGSGLNNIFISGKYTQDYNTVYQLVIATNGSPDEFQWRKSLNNGITFGAWSTSTGVTTTPTELEYGVNVEFGSISGHTIGDIWQFAAFSQIPQATVTIAPMGFAEILATFDYTQPFPEYIDITTLGNGTIVGGQFGFMSGSGSTLQAIVWGTTVPIASVYVNVLTGGTSLTAIFEYWNGSSWIALTAMDNFLIDGTNNMNISGRVNWELNTMSAWTKTAIPNMDVPLYWMRGRTSTNAVIAPVFRSVSVGNDKRFSIYDTYNSVIPSYYVDSLGRVNIGGGNITGSNKLQVNTGNNVSVTASGTDSLVEFDSENSAVVDLKLKLASNDACAPGLTFVKTRGTLDASSCTQTGDILSRIDSRGRAGTFGRLLTSIQSQFVGTGTTRCGDIFFKTANGSDPVEIVRMNYKGNTGFGITPTAVITLKAGSETNAPLKFTAGSLLTTPQAGAMEFDGQFTYITTSGLTRNTFACLNNPVFTGDVYLPSGTVFADGMSVNYIKPINDGLDTLKIISATGNTVLVTFNSKSGFTGFGTVIPETLIHAYGTDNTEGDGWNYQTNGLRLDGAFDADKDIQWATEGQSKFTAQIYRCEGGKFWYLSSPQGQINQLTVSQTGRMGVNNQTNIMDYHAVLQTGGPNDMTIGGLYTRNYTSVYEVEIDGTGATDTFKWRVSTDGGQTFSSWSASILCDNSPYELEYGVTVFFENITGHTLGSSWIFGAFAQLPVGTFVITPNKFTEVLTSDNFTLSAITYIDITGEANSSEYGALIDVFDVGETEDAIYFGTLDKLNSLYINIETAGQGLTLITEYWTGAAWVALDDITNNYNDETQNLTNSGGITWESNSMTGWIPAYLQDKVEEGYELYWIRIRTSTSPVASPIIKSFARNGNYRLAVFASPYDLKPSMYVDSLGRTNIGGGNISGKNMLQINSSHNVLPATGAPSLVEFDSEDSTAIDLKIKLASNDAYGAGINIGKTRGTLIVASNAQGGDEISHLNFRTFANNSGYDAASIKTIYCGDSTTKNADLILYASNASTSVEGIRIGALGSGFGGITPTALVHMNAGSTTVAPLKFTSGSLLSTPQSGAVEFLGDKFYGSTTGNTRKTFAFLESPIFTGAPELPVNTTLIGQSLCTLIMYSGGTYNPNLTTSATFNAYTASTVPHIDTTISGATNGLTKIDCHNVELGGAFTHATQLGACQYDFTVCSKVMTISSHEGTNIYDNIGCDINIFSCGGSVNLRGQTTGGTYATRFTLNQSQALFADARSTPRGIEYCQDYGLTYSNRSLVDKEYVDNKAAGLNPLSAVDVATTGNINLTSAPATIDGITVVNGMRILVKNQVSGQTNGIYIFNGSGSTMTRSLDFDTDSEVVKNSYVAVLTGSTNQNTSWILNTPNPITVGVTSLTFVLFASQSGVVGGNGICVTQGGGNYNVAIKTPSSCGLCSDATGIYVNPNIAGTGLNYTTGVLSVCGSALAGNSLSWVANQFAVNITGGTLNTALNSKLNTSAFNSYSGSTATDINSRALKTSVATYTGTTAPAQFANRTTFNTYTGTTAPNTYVCKSNFNTYTGATQTAIGLKANTASPTFTGTVRSVTPTVNDNSTCIATTAWYIGQCATAAPLMNGTAALGTSTLWTKQDHVHPSDTSRVAQTLFNTYTGTTAPATFASKTSVATYTGTTAPAQFVGKTAFNTYSGTTVPATYVNKTNFNTYTGATNTRLNSKLSLSGGTMTGALNAVKPAQNDNTTCVATTSWYISQAGTANPLMNGTVAVGTSNLFSRQDHIHASDTAKLSKAGDTMTGTLTAASCLNVSGATRIVGITNCEIAYANPTTGVLTGSSSLVFDGSFLCAPYFKSTGTDSYLYSECTVNRTTTSTTAIKAHGLTGSTMAGTYRVDFNAMFGNATTNGCTMGEFRVDGTNWGTRVLYRINAAGANFAQGVSRDITLTAASHRFEIWYCNAAGTACIPLSSIRVSRVC